MMRRRCVQLAVMAVALSPLAGAADLRAQTPANVAVVINETSQASQRVGEHYVRARAIPDRNVIRLRTLATETIERAAFVRTIQEPIAAALRAHGLHDRVLYIVLTKDVPLRIAGAEGTTGTIASVDSELTLLYRRMTGVEVGAAGRVDNPYFLGGAPIERARRFSRREHDIYLVSRLDAFTLDEALALVEGARAPSREGRIVLDQRGGLHRAQAGDTWLAAAAARLREAGLADRVVLEQTTDPVGSVDGVLGYYSWGSNDPQNRVRRYGMRFVPGAVAATFVSTDARTFQPPPEDWEPSDDWARREGFFGGSPQSLIGDLIREGATGVAGHVAEPYLQSTVRPEILFPAYLAGFNLIESFYLAIPHLSWQTVVIGDPLCAPFERPPLTTDDIELPADAAAEAPGLFAARWMAQAARTFKGVAPELLPLLLRTDERVLRGDRAGAIRSLEEITARAPSLTALELRLALMYEAAGHHAQAAERYRAVLKSAASHVVALNNLAHLLAVHLDAAADALPLARRAAALAPTDPAILDTLGWVEHLAGNHKEALRILSDVVAREPSRADFRLHAAFAYLAVGDRLNAQQQLAEAVRLDPALDDSTDVRRLREQLMR